MTGAWSDAGEPDRFAQAFCPWCGAEAELAVDPGGEAEQRYVEDCAVCCRPWEVTVRFDDAGRADVHLERADD